MNTYMSRMGTGNTSTGNVAWFPISVSGTTYTVAGSNIASGIQPIGLAEDSDDKAPLSTGGSTDLEAYTMSSGALTSAVTSKTGTDPVGAVAYRSAMTWSWTEGNRYHRVSGILSKPPRAVSPHRTFLRDCFGLGASWLVLRARSGGAARLFSIGLRNCGFRMSSMRWSMSRSARRTAPDRVAPVSDGVCQVVNGQPLEVLEYGRRFLKVETDKNEIGWIDDAVIDAKTYDGFGELAEQHKRIPWPRYHLARRPCHAYSSGASETEQPLAGEHRGNCGCVVSAPKKPEESLRRGRFRRSESRRKMRPPLDRSGEIAGRGELCVCRRRGDRTAGDGRLAAGARCAGRVGSAARQGPTPRAGRGLGQYGEDQRFIGCWLLTRVADPEADTPDHQVPEYDGARSASLWVAVRLRPGTRSRGASSTIAIHAFRLHPIQGYLPVRVFTENTPKGSVPAFSFVIATNGDVIPVVGSVLTSPLVAITKLNAGTLPLGVFSVNTRTGR